MKTTYSKNSEKRFIQVYTGNGKGKTTAAIGQVIRALGAGWRVCFVQFMKNFPYHELNILRHFQQNLTIRRYGDDAFVFQKQPPSRELIEEMHAGLAAAKRDMLSGEYDLLVLDEILVSIYFGLYTTEEVLHFLDKKPSGVELVLTGRYCPDAIMERADLVTEMKEIKHYYKQGVKSRKGIEH